MAKEVINPSDIVGFFQYEYSEYGGGEKSLSAEDRQFMKIMDSSLQLSEDGHIQLALPIKN